MSINEASSQKEKITIILVIGQSNAEGAGYKEEKGIILASNGKWQLSALPATAEYGTVFMTTSSDGISSLDPSYEYSTNFLDKQGGFAPAFAAKWNELTGEKVVILQLAVGATNLAEWQKDANVKGLYKELKFAEGNGVTGNRGYSNKEGYFLYKNAVKAYNSTYEALSKHYTINNSFYLWNQGESNELSTAETHTIYGDKVYAKHFEKMHENLINDCTGLKFGAIIAVRSCRAISNSENKVISASSTGPRRAQYRLSYKRDDLYTVSWSTEDCNCYANYWNSETNKTLYGKDHDLVPSYKGTPYPYSNMHFSQLKYNEMGYDGAENLYKILYGKNKFNGVAVINANGELIGKFDCNGNGKYVIKNDHTIKTRYLQIRPENASCSYDFSLKINIKTATLQITLYTKGHPADSGDKYISEYGEINWSELNCDSLNISCRIKYL